VEHHSTHTNHIDLDYRSYLAGDKSPGEKSEKIINPSLTTLDAKRVNFNIPQDH